MNRGEHKGRGSKGKCQSAGSGELLRGTSAGSSAEAHIRQLEYQEEGFTTAALAAGIAVVRRFDISGYALLQIEPGEETEAQVAAE
jgi:hypothetical protein